MQALVRPLPLDLPAAILMVLHLSADYPSLLPQILSRAGRLPAKHPQDGELIQHGQIYVAPPDRHLMIRDGTIRISRGPRENRHRPAIDPLFRTAARFYGDRVIGIVLSGHLDDGAAGLHAVHSCGGISIVQDPADAVAHQMPEAALRYGSADYVLAIDQIGPRVVDLVDSCGSNAMQKKKPEAKPIESEGMENLNVSHSNEGAGVPSPFACPDCGGVLWELKAGEMVRFRCRVGHAYTMATLAEEQQDGVEDALWAAMRALEEKAALNTRMSETTQIYRARERLLEQAQADRNYAETIRKMLFSDGESESKRTLPAA